MHKVGAGRLRSIATTWTAKKSWSCYIVVFFFGTKPTSITGVSHQKSRQRCQPPRSPGHAILLIVLHYVISYIIVWL